jgi:DNA-directed RNA polymerase specialized sigma24 family protein
MSDKKQTAVGWIEDNIQSDMTFMDVLGLIRQAKELEKQEIMQAYVQGFSECDTAEICGPIKYYSETYEQ